jgi:hypothetical protein
MGTFFGIPNINTAGLGLKKGLSPIPMLGGALHATHLPGSGWSGADNALDDYTGAGRAITLNSATLNAYSLTGSAVAAAALPFSPADLASGAPGLTMMGIFKVPTTAATVPLFTSAVSGVNQYISLHAQPNDNNIIAYLINGSGGANQTTQTLGYTGSQVEGQNCTYGLAITPAIFPTDVATTPTTPGSIKCFMITDTGAYSEAVIATSLRMVAVGPIKVASISGANNVELLADAYYRKAISQAEALAAHAAWTTKFATVGITV